MKNTGMDDQHFFNRDLSWIDFNRRVLEEGLRKDIPPLERFRFLSIVSSNLDEFFMVRIAAIKRAIRSQGGIQDPSGLNPAEQLRLASARIRLIFKELYDCLESDVFPALAMSNLELVRPDSYTPAQRSYLESFFMREIYPILTPLRLNEEERMPAIESMRLHAAFLLSLQNEQKDGSGVIGPLPPDGRQELISIIRIPQVLDRIIWLPRTVGGLSQWALLDDIVLTWGDRLYQGCQVKERMLFKVNRDADFSVDERRDEDFIEAMEEVLVNRENSMAVCMIYSPGSGRLRDELARRLDITELDLYECGEPLSLEGLLSLVSVKGFDQLKETPWKIYGNPTLPPDKPLWERISQGDILLHLPYESFDPVIRFFQEAANDPQVISIKTALYRTSGNSPIIRALEQASLKGKHVTAMVELKARFDEERNISWANRLEKAGVIVIYGLARLKVHAKISMVIRREHNRIKRYVHLSTGNYNDGTAKLYDDLSLFTVHEEIAYDAGLFFNMITGYSVIQSTRKLVIAPTSLKRRLLELIERETDRASQEYSGCIMAKMNALADIDLIRALYRASQAGVRVLLCVRGICQLVPGVPGLSENIQVISIIDHYLEHSRIFFFSNGGAEEIYLSSADWMPRNMERRIELMFPILDEGVKRNVQAILAAYFHDNCQARQLSTGGEWKLRGGPSGEEPFRAQSAFQAQAAQAMGDHWSSLQEFVIRRSPAN
ncbi:MAG: polyphosphate kinase 1 [Treponema sp.]|jgi:polyphosphate kinase|nr:polyphosphate kinase 1 [Treponema sp.]